MKLIVIAESMYHAVEVFSVGWIHEF